MNHVARVEVDDFFIHYVLEVEHAPVNILEVGRALNVVLGARGECQEKHKG